MENIKDIPHDETAEKAVLGSVLICRDETEQKDVLYRIRQKIRSSDFYRQANRIIYDAMENMDKSRIPIDSITLIEYLEGKKQLMQVGGVAYVTALCNVMPSSVNAEHYAKIVKKKSDCRKIINACFQCSELAYSGNDKEAMAVIEQKIFAVQERNDNDPFTTAEQLMLETGETIQGYIDNKGCLNGIDTGYSKLNRITNGWQKSNLIILAARPSMGKTAFALNLAFNAAKENKKTGKKQAVLFFSLEMSQEQLGLRLVAMRSIVPSNDIKTGNISKNQFDKTTKALDEIRESGIIISNVPGYAIDDIVSLGYRAAHQKNVKLIIIDYLQLIQGNKNKNRVDEITEISNKLQALARDLNIPVIALSQLSRGVESRQDKRPMLSDLRDSGAIEQDADIVMFLYRDDYYYPDGRPDGEDVPKGKTKLIIAKNRNGELAKINLFFHYEYGRFEDCII